MANVVLTPAPARAWIKRNLYSSTRPPRAHTWLYVRIYCPPAMNDDVILHLIRPAISELRAQNLIARFFFIRYCEGGNHIRLRVYGRHHIVLGPVRMYLNEQIERFFAERGYILNGPSDPGPDGMDDLLWQPWQPHGVQRPVVSYEYDRYLPETSRYGGREGLHISERHFEQSSAIAFRILEHERAGHGTRQNAALLLMEAATDAFGLSPEEKVTAFARQSCYWIRSRWLTINDAHWFNREYERFRRPLSLLIPHTNQTSIEHRGRVTWSSIVQQWHREMAEIYQELLSIQRQGRLITPISTLLLFYTHMLCNRLGITPPYEACLAYLLHRHYAEQSGLPILDFLTTPTEKLDELIAPMVAASHEDRQAIEQIIALLQRTTPRLTRVHL
jgi:thiopeptide-type bacteriocin biosynthesis protein